MQEVETRNRGIQGIKEKTGLFIAGFVFAEREIFVVVNIEPFTTQIQHFMVKNVHK